MAGNLHEKTYRLTQTVIMVGMMGAGKTAVGRSLAELLDVAFIDSDHEIEAAANLSIAEIFDREGEGFFRAKETQVLTRLLQGEASIVSTGGGAFLQERNRNVIANGGVSVWLKADLELLWERVRHKTTRPLLRTDNPKKTLTDLYTARVPVYEKAQVWVNAESGLNITDMADKVVAALIDAGVLFLEGEHL